MDVLKKYFRIKLKSKNKHKALTVIYAIAITFAFIMSLTNNNDVSASVSKNDSLNYLTLESQISNNMDEHDTIYPANSVENIRSLFEMVNYVEAEKEIEREVEVARGDTFISILGDLGLGRKEANDIYTTLKKVYDPKNLRAGQKILVTTVMDNKNNKLISLENITIEPVSGQRFIIEKNDKNIYIAKSQKDELVEEINSAHGVINGALSSAMKAQNVPHKISAEFAKIFASRVDFRRDVKKGDKFEIIYENHIAPSGQVVKTGNILYASIQLRKEKVALYRFKDKAGNIDYYNEKGIASSKKTLHRKPLAFQNARISSPFGKRRHPIFKDLRIHWGVDYAAPRGTAVYAAGDGVVQEVKYNGGYGKYIRIKHNSEYYTAYGHLNGYAKGIRSGVRVKQGQIIAYVGSTGRSTGPHLHYEVVQNGRRVNPTTIKASAGENLAGVNLTNFKQRVANIKETHNRMFAQSDPKKLAQK